MLISLANLSFWNPLKSWDKSKTLSVGGRQDGWARFQSLNLTDPALTLVQNLQNQDGDGLHSRCFPLALLFLQLRLRRSDLLAPSSNSLGFLQLFSLNRRNEGR